MNRVGVENLGLQVAIADTHAQSHKRINFQIQF